MGLDIIVKNEAAAGVPDKTVQWDRICGAAERHGNSERAKWDKFRKLYKEGHFEQANDAGDAGANAPSTARGVSANKTFQRIEIMMAVLAASEPVFQVDPLGQDPGLAGVAGLLGIRPEVARRILADAKEEVLQTNYTRTRGVAQQQAAVFEALVTGLGFGKASFDPVRGCARVDALRRDECYVDPLARGEVEDARYFVHTATKGIEEAREFFERLGVPPEKIIPNWELGDGDGYQSQVQQQGQGGEKGEKSLFRFHEVWAKGRGDERLTYWKTWSKRGPESVIAQASWPFTLDIDALPVADLAFHRQFLQLDDAFPGLYVVEELRRAYEEMVDFFKKHTGRSIARKLVIPSWLHLTADQINRLLTSKDMDTFEVDVPVGTDVRNAIGVVNFNDGQSPETNLAEYMDGTADKVLGMDELQQGVANRQKMTATEADIRDAWGRLRVGRWQAVVDRWNNRLALLRAQIDQALMDPADVALIVERPEAALLWQLNPGDPSKLAQGYSIQIAAGSTGERHKQQKLQRLTNALTEGKDLNKLYGAPVVDCLQLYKQLLEADEHRQPERYLNESVIQFVMGQFAMQAAAGVQPGQGVPGALPADGAAPAAPPVAPAEVAAPEPVA